MPSKACNANVMIEFICFLFFQFISYKYEGDDVIVSKLMMEIWGNFAKLGAPSSKDLPAGWPKYTAQSVKRV